MPAKSNGPAYEMSSDRVCPDMQWEEDEWLARDGGMVVIGAIISGPCTECSASANLLRGLWGVGRRR